MDVQERIELVRKLTAAALTGMLANSKYWAERHETSTDFRSIEDYIARHAVGFADETATIIEELEENT